MESQFGHLWIPIIDYILKNGINHKTVTNNYKATLVSKKVDSIDGMLYYVFNKNTNYVISNSIFLIIKNSSGEWTTSFKKGNIKDLAALSESIRFFN